MRAFAVLLLTIGVFSVLLSEALIADRSRAADRAGAGFTAASRLRVGGAGGGAAAAAGGRIVVERGWGLWTMDASGGGLRRLTRNGPPTGDRDPVWSPDGTRVAFVRPSGAGSRSINVYVVSADGGGLHRLTRTRSIDGHPAWSPDGETILFSSIPLGQGSRQSGLFVVDADGRNRQRLAGTERAVEPAWSSTGEIAFVAYGAKMNPGSAELYVMNPDGSARRWLTHNTALDDAPAWSPDGAKLLFVRQPRPRASVDSEIWVINADGSGQRQITQNTVFDNNPSWAPDGTRFAFDSVRGHSHDVYVMSINGGSARRLIHGGATHPAWQQPVAASEIPAPPPFPASSTLAYLPYSGSSICVVTLDGSAPWQLTSSSDDSQTSWSPDGRHLAFSRLSRDAAGNAAAADVFTVAVADGTLTPVSRGYAPFNEQPDWSPDGRWIVFVAAPRWGENSDMQLVVAAADGTSVRPLPGAAAPYLSTPSWSPDGNWITYTQSAGGDTPPWIYVVSARGGIARRVAAGRDPDWSPDGRRLVYLHYHGASSNPGELVVSNLYGGQRQVLRVDHFPAEYFSSAPAWSPDGRWIAYSYEGHFDPPHIEIVPAEGGQPQTVVNWARDPSWAPAVRLPQAPNPTCH